MPQAIFAITKETPNYVFITDTGSAFVKRLEDDAEHVVEKLARLHALNSRRLFYKDLNGAVGEILHTNGVFTGFKPGHEGVDLDTYTGHEYNVNLLLGFIRMYGKRFSVSCVIKEIIGEGRASGTERTFICKVQSPNGPDFPDEIYTFFEGGSGYVGILGNEMPKSMRVLTFVDVDYKGNPCYTWEETLYVDVDPTNITPCLYTKLNNDIDAEPDRPIHKDVPVVFFPSRYDPQRV